MNTYPLNQPQPQYLKSKKIKKETAMNIKTNSVPGYTQEDESYYQHLEDKRIEKENYRQDFNVHLDEIFVVLNSVTPDYHENQTCKI